MAERPDRGVLDTCVFIDLGEIDPAGLPRFPDITSITMAELHQGVAMAKDPVGRARRMEKLQAAVRDFSPLPFGGEAAARYGTLVALTLAANRNPKPRRLDLMIAAVASLHGLPLYTRNADDFAGLDSAVQVVPV
ncbi:type II toxin-antitoxin system VapC family toxin [Nocardiopsis algeriensis]|uniref:PIN domain-containing protein n=1 Tax=Nocardiopsis algeriensis TaxID=1478215 RepID=A0A841IKC4_9ACTN|nr:type II toxin-antitoxin system VapC family toxin [Nocardiopsis algeriensis]MBB6118414.1 hypothetical protein [Nocardiopsis algeriensis]